MVFTTAGLQLPCRLVGADVALLTGPRTPRSMRRLQVRASTESTEPVGLANTPVGKVNLLPTAHRPPPISPTRCLCVSCVCDCVWQCVWLEFDCVCVTVCVCVCFLQTYCPWKYLLRWRVGGFRKRAPSADCISWKLEREKAYEVAKYCLRSQNAVWGRKILSEVAKFTQAMGSIFTPGEGKRIKFGVLTEKVCANTVKRSHFNIFYIHTTYDPSKIRLVMLQTQNKPSGDPKPVRTSKKKNVDVVYPTYSISYLWKTSLWNSPKASIISDFRNFVLLSDGQPYSTVFQKTSTISILLFLFNVRGLRF
jgi:hypothetical protein